MNGRAVIEVKNLAQIGSFFELREKLIHPTVAIQPSSLGCGPDDPEFVTFRQQPAANGFTAAVGRRLYDALNGSPSVAEQLAIAISHHRPVYITDQGAEAQALPWEALCRSTDGMFLALDGGLPVGRMVGALEAREIGRYVYDPPVRVLAVLAAAGGDARDTAIEEWRSLSTAVFASATPCRLRVIGADGDVQEAVEANTGVDGFEFLVEPDTVLAAVRDFRPHLIHLFCHGFTEPEPKLELATRGDQRGPDPTRGSVKLDRRSFAKIRAEDPSLLLVTLNCCLGAAASDSGQPVARQIVQEGVPAVVAMQEPVDRRDAHLFCRYFYASVLAALGRALEGPAPQDFDWAETLAESRHRLVAAHEPQLGGPEHTKEWTLPVVYVHSDPFRVAGRVAPGVDPVRVAELMAQLDELEQSRNELAKVPNMPSEALDAIDRKIASIETELFGSGDHD